MDTNTQGFASVLAALADESQPFTAATIYGLSGLGREQLTQLQANWDTYTVERRRKLLQHLNAVGETNFEMDFRDINHLALTDADSEVRQYAIEGLWEDESPALLHKLVAIAREDASLDVRAAAVIELGRFILLGEYEEIDESHAQLAQNIVLQIFHSNEDDELRRRALEAIANCGHPDIRQMILEMYEHHDIPLRMSAIFAMGRTCDTAWAPDIIREMNSSEPQLQYEAIRAAGHLELAEAVPHINRLIEETEDSEILEIAIWALGEIGSEAARQTLTNIITWAEAENEEELLEAAQEAYDSASLPGDFLLFDFEP